MKNIYTNIPTKTLMDNFNLTSNDNSTGDWGKGEDIELSRVIVSQKYFNCTGKYHTHKTGLAVGAHPSSITSYIYSIKNIPIFLIHEWNKITKSTLIL